MLLHQEAEIVRPGGCLKGKGNTICLRPDKNKEVFWEHQVLGLLSDMIGSGESETFDDHAQNVCLYLGLYLIGICIGQNGQCLPLKNH